MATISTELKKIFRDNKLTDSAKLINKDKIELFSIPKLISEFNLGLLDGGRSSAEEAELPEDAIRTFEEVYFKPVENRVVIKVDEYKQGFSYQHMISNLQSFILGIENIPVSSENLKSSIDVDNYLATMLENDTLGIIAVKFDDKTYFYFFRQIPPMVKKSTLQYIQDSLENDSKNTDELNKLAKEASLSRKQNKKYLTFLDEMDTPRALFDKQAREQVVYINTLNTLIP